MIERNSFIFLEPSPLRLASFVFSLPSAIYISTRRVWNSIVWPPARSGGPCRDGDWLVFGSGEMYFYTQFDLVQLPAMDGCMDGWINEEFRKVNREKGTPQLPMMTLKSCLMLVVINCPRWYLLLFRFNKDILHGSTDKHHYVHF